MSRRVYRRCWMLLTLAYRSFDVPPVWGGQCSSMMKASVFKLDERDLSRSMIADASDLVSGETSSCKRCLLWCQINEVAYAAMMRD